MSKRLSIEPDFRMALDTYSRLESARIHKTGVRVVEGARVATTFSGFLASDPDAPRSLSRLVKADVNDVDRFLDSVGATSAKGYRLHLIRFYEHLVSTGVAEANPAQETLPRRPDRRPPLKPMSQQEWNLLIEAARKGTTRLGPLTNARNLAILEVCRNISVPPSKLSHVTLGMGRQGVVTVEDKGGYVRHELGVDARCAIQAYLQTLPVHLPDDEPLFRNKRLKPVSYFVIMQQIHKIAESVGIKVQITRFGVAPDDDEVDINKLIESFHRIHPRSQ